MSDTLDLFDSNSPDARLSRILKEEGMERALACAEEMRPEMIAQAREDCRLAALARPSRCASANDYFRAIKRRGGMTEPDPLGPAAGALFKTSEWRPYFIVSGVQQRVKSERPTNHSRDLLVWKLVE